jgi:hypothetical protein
MGGLLVAVLLFSGCWKIASDKAERWQQILIGPTLQREGESDERGGRTASSPSTRRMSRRGQGRLDGDAIVNRSLAGRGGERLDSVDCGLPDTSESSRRLETARQSFHDLRRS